MYTFLSPAAAFACAIALSTSVTNVKVVAPATRTSRGRCVGTKTGILNGGSSPQPCTWSYTPRPATTAPAAANNSSIIQRSPPGRSTSPPVPSGCSSPASGPVMNPSSDIDRLISTTPIWASCNHGLGHQHTLGPPPCPASPARGVARSHRVSRAISLVGEVAQERSQTCELVAPEVRDRRRLDRFLGRVALQDASDGLSRVDEDRVEQPPVGVTHGTGRERVDQRLDRQVGEPTSDALVPGSSERARTTTALRRFASQNSIISSARRHADAGTSWKVTAIQQRSGLFWDAIHGRAPTPPAASTLGFHLISAEPDHGLITVGFVATRSFTNPFGEVLGGFLAAMLVTATIDFWHPTGMPGATLWRRSVGDRRERRPRGGSMTVWPVVTLRQATATDAPKIADIWHLGWRDGHLGFVPQELVAARHKDSFRTKAARRVSDTTVAVIGGEVAGFVMVVGDEVEQVYVAASHRGTGVADTLMTEAERQITRAGHSTASGPVIVRITPERPTHGLFHIHSRPILTATIQTTPHYAEGLDRRWVVALPVRGGPGGAPGAGPAGRVRAGSVARAGRPGWWR